MKTGSYGDASRVVNSNSSERSNALLEFEAFNQHLTKIKGEQMKDWYGKSHLASGESAIDALYDTLGIEETFLPKI